jgi:hypothetical protein
LFKLCAMLTQLASATTAAGSVSAMTLTSKTDAVSKLSGSLQTLALSGCVSTLENNMRGKYSPTVSRAYMADQKWWSKYAYAGKADDEYAQYDPEGYDSYGYDKNDVDRAGNYELEYYSNDSAHPEHADYNIAYDTAYNEWDFDGVKPVRN